jgi:hypothetical protein
MVKYIHEAIHENLLTLSSRLKKYSARIDLLQAVQFIADSWRKVSIKTIQDCFAHCGSDTQTCRCRMGPILEMTSYCECTTSEITKSFHVLTAFFSVVIKMKIVRKQLLNKFETPDDIRRSGKR